MAVVFNVPWYATGFRGDRVRGRRCRRSRRSRCATARPTGRSTATRTTSYKFQQLATFEDAAAYTLYWNGPEFSAWRADYSGWYQVPVVYAPMRLVATGRSGRAERQRQPRQPLAHAD